MNMVKILLLIAETNPKAMQMWTNLKQTLHKIELKFKGIIILVISKDFLREIMMEICFRGLLRDIDNVLLVKTS